MKLQDEVRISLHYSLINRLVLWNSAYIDIYLFK
uniref:Uncharacterized protein n=1 Tax=Heterorhabditis bacteriophora TaxID=37862 RepID=A0A1I7X828_HETBA